ncbi:S41 family peptidase [uncultured Shewanella sp.]|uniref:S41 family peptidase n=1 Tax=uncultured Shewanella sp. TaxID=173975 RepID=UPI00260B58DE|nr:S41 family peptidase [uncultured Shewanella sp.]
MKSIYRYISCVAIGLTLGLSITLLEKSHSQEYSFRSHYPLLLEVMDSIQTYYVDPISEDELMQAAIEGVFDKLDAYSGLLDKQDFQNIKDSNNGEYFGFGIEIAIEDDKITIITPFAHSPAAQAGIKPGDQIISLNQQTVTSDKLNALLSEMKQHSKDKKAIDIMLTRASTQKTYSVTLKPSTIKITSVKAQLLDNQIGYIRLYNFQENSTKEIISHLFDWQAIPLQGIILDLRNNPGGLLDQAVSIADIFLDKGLIVSTQGRYFDANSDYYASSKSMHKQIPLLVIINKGSASASEVLAAALQDNQRAKLIGQTSYGKGTVQSLIPTLIDGHAIKLTIANYTTPKGKNINKTGIEPNIKIALDKTEADQMLSLMALSDIQQDKLLNTAITWFDKQQP